MLTREKDIVVTTRERSHGGNGTAVLKNLMYGDTMPKHARLVSVITLEPGCSFGMHKHVAESELYYVLKGEATVAEEGGETYIMKAGDAAVTKDGGSHSVANAGKETLDLLAIVFKED